ncbi:MAG: DMT family transporter [Actinomycetota bacterium]|nr:DMT family transporter [Actinomycetota bacterium]
MRWLLFPLAVAAGAALPIQFSINAQLRGWLGGSALVAAAVSFLVGMSALVLVAVILREPLATGNIVNVPWWLWTGGIIGAFYVASSIVLLPRLGAAATTAFILGGQVAASLILDHFGLLHLTQHEIGPGRAIGAALIVAGVALVQVY